MQGSLETQPWFWGEGTQHSDNTLKKEIEPPSAWSNFNQEIFFPNTKADFFFLF